MDWKTFETLYEPSDSMLPRDYAVKMLRRVWDMMSEQYREELGEAEDI
jgi:hypothetical protein